MEMRKICSGCRDGINFEIPFAMAFQPIVDIETGTPFAYEALVRGVDGAGAATILSRVTDENRYSLIRHAVSKP
jgi:EAL domain-containing protein (putative c-di-GMP-specific phosphodiesterase class I)